MALFLRDLAADPVVDPKLFSHPDQIRERVGTHFAHNMSSMDLDSKLAYAQFGRNLFVEQARDHLPHHFLLTDRKSVV